MRKSISPCCGYPVVYDDEFTRRIAEACGAWPLAHYILVGPVWMLLPEPERRAVLYHEAGHLHHMHMERRALLLLLALPKLLLDLVLRRAPRMPAFIETITREQEMEADRFAADRGCGEALARFLSRSREDPSMFYPSYTERVLKLRAWLTREAPCSAD